MEEGKETEAISEMANQNAKKVHKLNAQLREKEEELNKESDRANEMSNKLNDVQAAAYFKDEKIKKLN